MAASLELRSEAVRSLAFGSIGAAYAAVGSKLERQVRMVFVQNNTDAELMFSFDGVNDHFPLASRAFLLLDVTANDINAAGFYISKGTQFQVKRIGTPTAGNVYISTFYARGS